MSVGTMKPHVKRRLEILLEEYRNRKPRTRGKHRVEIDGKFYRRRRGVLVEIPPEWLGHTTHKQTIRKRASKKNQGASFKPAVQR